MFERVRKRLVPIGRAHTWLRHPIFGVLLLVWGLDAAWGYVRQDLWPLVYTKGRAARNAARQWCIARVRAVKADAPQYRRHAPRRAMAAALALVMCLGMLPVSALAAEQPAETAPTGCTHAHDEACGFVEAVVGAPCTHEHDATCGGLPPVEPVDPVCETCDAAHETADCPAAKEQLAAPVTPVTRAAATYPIVITSSWGSPSAIYAYGTPLVIEEHADSTFNITCTTVYIDKNSNGVADTEDPSLLTAGILNAPADNVSLANCTIYGGGNNSATNIPTTRITMNGGEVGNIYGGGKDGTGIVETTNVTINAGKVGNNVCGGGSSGCVAANTNVTMKGGEVVSYIYGGNGASDDTQVTTSTTILVEGGRVTQSVFGGSGKGVPIATTSITVRGTGVVKEYVRGANSSEADGGKTSIIIGGGAQVGAQGFHSGVYLYDTTKPTNVQRFTISPALTGRVQVVLSDTYDASSEPTIATGAVEGDSGKITLYYICAENYVTYFENGMIKVKPKVLVDAVSLDKAELTFTLDETAAQQLTATVTPADADNKTVTWSSSDKNIVTVDANGLVTAVARGAATITATASGKTATCTVTVKLPEIPADNITVTPQKKTYDGTAHDMVTVTKPEGAMVEYRTDGTSFSTNVPQMTNVADSGSVWVKVTQTGYEPYESRELAATVSAVTLTPTIDMVGYTPREYDGTTKAEGATITLKGANGEEKPTATATVTFDSADAETEKTVSATNIKLPSNTVNNNYTLSTTTLSAQQSTASITPREVPVVWDVPSLIYTGEEQSASIKAAFENVAKEMVPLTVSFDENVTFQDADNYTATATMVSPDGNYTLTDATKTVTIGKATPTITPPAGETHDVTSVTLTAATTTGGGAITYGWSLTDDSSGITDWKSDLTFTGLTSSTTYYFFAKAAANDNYNEATSAALEVTTTAKSLSSIEIATPPTKTAYTAYEKFDTSGMVVTASYDDATSAAVTGYTVSYPNGSDSFHVSDKQVTITYNKKTTTQTVTVTPAAGEATISLAGWTYGDTEKTPAHSTTTNTGADTTVEYKLTASEDGTYSTDVPTNAGSYTVRVTYAATDNYTAATATANFTIAPRVAEFTWKTPSSLVYDGAEKQVTATVKNKVETDTVTCVLSGDKGTNADTYTATVTALSDNDLGNYTLEGSTATRPWSITQRPVTITATNQQVVYGDAISTRAYSATLLIGHQVGELTLISANKDVTTTGVITASNATIMSDDTDVTENYDITYVDGTLKITPKTDAKLTITLGAAPTYKGLPQTQTITSVKVGETVISPYDVSGNSQTNAGTYSLTVTATGGNYAGSNGKAEWSIENAPLLVTAKNHTITYGEAPDNNGVDYTGFENGETATVLGGDLSYTYSYKQFDNVGSNYTITPAGLTSDNYAITFADGMLTVEKKAIGLAWVDQADLTYDGEEKAPTVTATDTVNGDELAVVFSRTSGDGKSVGAHTYTATGLTGDKAGNYKLPTEASHTVNISAAPPKGVTATGYSGTYDGTAHDAITVKTGGMTGETEVTFSTEENGTYTKALTVTNVADSGTYYYKLVNQNYSDFKGSATVTITPKALSNDMLTITGTYTYTGAAQTPTFTAEDAAASLTAGDYDAVPTNHTNAGTATLTLFGKGNYTGTATKTFEIGKKQLAETMIDAIAAQTYTGAKLEPTITTKAEPTLATTDYTLSYGDNINVATGGTVTITATDGNYSGSATRSFSITQCPYDENSFTITISNPAYTGVAVTPTVKVVYGGMELVENTDYTVSFSDNINVGTDSAKASFAFIGNYKGTAEKTFSIVNNPLPADDFENALGVTAKELAGWHNADIVLRAQADWTIGKDAGKLGATVELSTEGKAVTQELYLKKTGETKVYQTTVTYALDKTAPVADYVSGNPTEWQSTDAAITFSVTEATSGVKTVTVKRGDVDYTVTDNKSFTADQNGAYTISVTDNAGNVSEDCVITVSKIDNTKPTASIATATDAPSSGWFTTAVTVNVTVTEANPKQWEYTTDGSTWKTGSGTSFTISVNGDYKAVQVKAIDQAGNEGLSNELAVKLDTATPTAPTVKVEADGKEYTSEWTAANVVFTLFGTETTSGHAEYQVKVGGAEWADVTGSTYTVSDNTTGDDGVNYQFRAVNNAGTEGAASGNTLVKRRALSDDILSSEANKYTADNVKISDATITGNWYTTAPTVTVTRKEQLADNPAETWYKLDDGTETKLTGTDIPITTDGNHTLTIWTKDAAGNRTTALPVTIKVDTKAPEITGVSGNAATWQNTNVTLAIAATDATSKLAAAPYSFDGGKTWQAEATKAYSENITLAADTIQVKDAAGNIAKYATEIKITKIDKGKPTVTIAPIPDGAKWYGKTEFTVTTNDEASGVETVSADKGTYNNGKLTVSEVAADTYTYTVTVVDNAGNESTATVTIQLDPIIDTFAKLVTDTDRTDLDKLLETLDTYSKYTPDQKAHIAASDLGAAAKETLDDAFTAKQDALLGEINGIIAKHPGETNLADIDRAEELYALLDSAHKEQIDKGYEQMLADRDAAKDAIEQLDKSTPSYEDMQTAQNTYDSLSENQQALVKQESDMGEKLTGLKNDMEAINKVIEMINAIQRPFKPETRADIDEAVKAFKALNDAQDELFPEAEYQRLIVLAYDRVDAETFIRDVGSLTVPYVSGQKEKILGYKDFRDMIMTPASLEMVPAEVKTKLEELYSAVLQAMDADEKAAEAFTQKVWQAAVAPSVSGIEELKKAHDTLSDGAKNALDEETKNNYDKMVATLTEAVKELSKDLEAVDISKLNPESKEIISALEKRYDALSKKEQNLVDAATGGKLQILLNAVKEAAKAEQAINNIPKHTDGSDISAGNCENQESSHTIADHKGAIEGAKFTYERLTDAGRALVSADAKAKLSSEYTALMKYLDYKNTADTASTKVEVAGLAEKVQLPVTAHWVTKTVIQVTMKDEKTDKVPETIADKKQALSVDIKLEAQHYKEDVTFGGTIGIQPKQGQTVLVKLKVPGGYQNDTLEIWHVKDSGPARQISALWLVTETDGVYAVFEVSSFSHFVLFAQPAPTSGGTPTYRPGVTATDNGSVTVKPQNPIRGQNVTITPAPDEGYVADKVIVTDQDGKEIPVKDNGDGTYSYTQPRGKVSITVTFKPAGVPFTDVGEKDWFYDSVKYAYEKGLMNGTATDKFSPYLDTSRAMVVTMLWRLEGEPKVEKRAEFSDVPADSWYTDAVAWATEQGIVEGDGKGRFVPTGAITREQLVAILYRYAQFKQMDTTAEADLSKFTDQPASWAAEAVRWAVGVEIISGKGGGILDPGGKATRAETAIMLERFLGK